MNAISLIDGKIWIKSDYQWVNICRSIPTAKWDTTKRAWHVVADAITIKAINERFPAMFIRTPEYMQLAETFAEFSAVRFSKENTTQPEVRIRDAWPHQAKAYNFSRDAGNALLGMWMGTGKTKTTVDFLQNTTESGEPNNVLIVAPIKVCEDDVWLKEFMKDCAVDYRVIDLVKDGKSGLGKAKIMANELMYKGFNGLRVFTTNYDSIYNENLLNVILANKWCAVVADESHHIKAPAGARSRAMKKIREVTQHRICLTGTPMAHTPLDIFAQFRFVNPMIFGDSITRFRARYVTMGGYENRQIIGYENVDEFQEKLSQSMFLLPTNSVLNLPEPLPERIIEGSLEPAARRVYLELENDLISQWKGEKITADNALVKMLRLQQFVGGWFKADESEEYQPISTVKAGLLRGVLEDLQEPVVVFAVFRKELETIRKIAGDLELQYSEISGEANDLPEWRQKGGVLGVQIGAGSEGIDLTMARVAIYYSTGFSLGRYEQSKARVQRPGQEKNVLYIHLSIKGTIDATIRRALREHRDDIDMILSGVS